MKIPIKRLKNGFEMPVYGLGTWQMGGIRERDILNDDNADILAIQSAIDAGVTHIDTAELYADGYAETLIGQAIKNYNRADLFLASKVLAKNLSYDDILNSCKQSLLRLNTPYLDLYLIHVYNKDLPLKDSMRALDKLVEEGLVRHIGVSNFTKEHLAEAQSYTKNKIVCNQVHYNLAFREAEVTGLLKYCQENDIFLSAYRPVQKGELLQDTPKILLELAEKYNKTVSQIAINWLVSQPNVITISKTRSLAHLEENLGALDWQMDPSDLERLRNEYPNQSEVSNAVPLG